MCRSRLRTATQWYNTSFRRRWPQDGWSIANRRQGELIPRPIHLFHVEYFINSTPRELIHFSYKAGMSYTYVCVLVLSLLSIPFAASPKLGCPIQTSAF
jgi:hypothetical protein